jgi:hypothetical protein
MVSITFYFFGYNGKGLGGNRKIKGKSKKIVK